MISISSIVFIIILIVLVYFAYINRIKLANIIKSKISVLNPYDIKDNVEDVIDDSTEFVALGADTVVNSLKKKIKKPKIKKPKIIKIDRCENKNKKEVFNISKNIFSYDEAKYVCKSFDSELATYNQVKRAHSNGANWCNYGWSSNQMALYPIQTKFYDNLTSDNKEKGICGKPGINGGYFKDSKLKFGVNCYGYKPKPDNNSLIYLEDNEEAPSRKDSFEKSKIEGIKNKLSKLSPYINQFASDKWSSGSCKRSYLLKDNNINTKLFNVSKESSDINDILKGGPMTEEFYSKIHSKPR